MNAPQETELLKPAQAAQMAGVQTETFWGWLRDDRVPHLRISGRYYLRRSSLLKWLDDQERGGAI